MIIRFCERQTLIAGSPTSCCILHNNRKIFEYRPVDAIPHISCAAQEDHCFFYRKGINIAAQTLKEPPRASAYGCYKIKETFQPDYGSPWKEWASHHSIQHLAADGFRGLQKKKKRRHSTEAVR